MSKPIVIFDIDGTLADCSERRAMLELVGNYKAFEEELWKDTPNKPIIALLRALRISEQFLIFLVSGRKEKYREGAQSWLRRWIGHDLDHDSVLTAVERRNDRILYDSLLMRKDDDNRCDTVVKLEMVKYFKNQILFVVDDRQKVVDMWRREGITCLQCADFKG